MRFQFHKGTIITDVAVSEKYKDTTFQFHKGTIITHGERQRIIMMHLFQFHKGTIITLCRGTTRRSLTISIP